MYPYPTVAASNPRSAYSRPETVSAMHPSPKSASRREFGTLRPRKGTLKVYNHVSFRNLFDFAKHRSPLPATSTPACPGRQKKFRTPYAAASSFPSHPLALFPKTRQQPVSPATAPAALSSRYRSASISPPHPASAATAEAPRKTKAEHPQPRQPRKNP